MANKLDLLMEVDNTIILGADLFVFLDNGISASQGLYWSRANFLSNDDYNTIAGGLFRLWMF
jgi:hypothetical protein